MKIVIVPPVLPTKTYPAYYLGRPVAMYRRRYRRSATAMLQPT